MDVSLTSLNICAFIYLSSISRSVNPCHHTTDILNNILAKFTHDGSLCTIVISNNKRRGKEVTCPPETPVFLFPVGLMDETTRLKPIEILLVDDLTHHLVIELQTQIQPAIDRGKLSAPCAGLWPSGEPAVLPISIPRYLEVGIFSQIQCSRLKNIKWWCRQ